MTISKYARLSAGFVVIGLACFLAAAQQPNAQPDSASTPHASVEGTVIEKLSGTPVPDAVVTIYGHGPKITAKTSSSGRYRITGLPPGRYSLSPRKEGYGRGPSTRPRRIRVTAGAKIANIDFQVQREAVVAGRVLDAANQPVQGQRVMVYARGYSQGMRSYDLRGAAPTNDLGEFRISGLTPGRYYLAAVPAMLRIQKLSHLPQPQPDAQPREAVEAEVRTFYMGAPSPAGATPLDLHGGEQRENADLTLARVKTYCVTGTIDQTGGETANLTITELAGDWSHAIASGVFSDGEGFEACGFPPGSYYLFAATATAKGELTRFARVDFTVNNRDIALDGLMLGSPLEIAGQMSVTGAESGPPSLESVYIGLRPSDRMPYINEAPEIELKRTGSFVLPGVFTGDYWATFRLPRELYVKAANCGVVNALREPLQAGCGQLHVVLGADGAAISGNVIAEESGAAVSGATVVLFPAPLPDSIAPGVFRTIDTDQNGEFEFASVAPGMYRLLAFHDLAHQEAEDPEFVRQWQSKGEEIEVGKRERKSATLKPLGNR